MPEGVGYPGKKQKFRHGGAVKKGADFAPQAAEAGYIGAARKGIEEGLSEVTQAAAGKGRLRRGQRHRRRLRALRRQELERGTQEGQAEAVQNALGNAVAGAAAGRSPRRRRGSALRNITQ